MISEHFGQSGKLPENYSNLDDVLRTKVYWHLEDLGLKGNEEYETRIEKELSMIEERHCADDFLIVSNLCEKIWEKGGVVGCGRGMSASLLVNYLIGITEINPLEYGLIPERFFSYNLDISPVFDLDVDEIGERIGKEYLKELYTSKNLPQNFYDIHLCLNPYLVADALSKVDSLSDADTMELFAKGDTVGVFQFESNGMKEWQRKLKPEKFEHLIALYSMFRPGSMDRIGWYSDLWKGLYKNLDFIHDDNPFANLHKYTDATYGMIIYQEQLMSIVSDVASFSLEDMRRLRKFAGPYKIQQMIGGQWVNVLEHLGKKFMDGGMANGYDKKLLEQFWNSFICTERAAYLFNKSHAVCYTLIAYRLAYLKVHEPALFYNTLYSSLSNTEDRKALYDDALQHGLVYMEQSGAFYQVIDD